MPRHQHLHWIKHTGPNNWYCLWFPPGWTLEVSDGTVGLAAPDQGGVLSITSFWLDEPGDGTAESIIDLERLFPRRRSVQPLKPIGKAETCVGFRGQSLLGGDASWWRRMFQKKQWRHWRVWSLRQGTVCVLALYLQTERHDPEAATVADMIVDSIEFSEHFAFPPEMFAQRVLDLARSKFPLLACESAPDFQIRLGDSKVNLFNFYRSYVKSPDEFESIVLPALTTVVQVQEWGKEQTEPPLADVQRRVMPMLYPEDVWQERFPEFVGMPWVGGLVVLYVVDESQSYWYIRDDLLEIWGLTRDDLHAVALENLNRYFDEQPMEFSVVGGEPGPRLLIPARQDAYNTSRLLSESFHEKLRRVLGDEFAVGAPSRDFFVAVSLDSAEAVEHIRKKVEDDYQNMDHPLSDRLLLVTHDGVTEYAPWV